MADSDNINLVSIVITVTLGGIEMDEGVKITQLRIPARLHELIRERAHETRQSLNQTMVQSMAKDFGEYGEAQEA
jgi:hypothetical protein